MKKSLSKIIHIDILPFIAVGLNAIAIILSFFEADEFFFEPALTILSWLVSIGICFLIIKYRDFEKEKSLIHFLTFILLIAYVVMVVINEEENLALITVPGEIALFLSMFIFPIYVFLYLIIYASFRFGWFSFEKAKFANIFSMIYALVLVVSLSVGFHVGNSFGDLFPSLGTQEEEEHVHRCITCGEVKYIVNKTNGYWICKDCLKK